jgi:hypothetical protein
MKLILFFFGTDLCHKKNGFLNRTPRKISKLAEFSRFSAKNVRLITERQYSTHGSLLFQFLPDTIAFGLYRRISISVFPLTFDKNCTKTFHFLQFLLHGLRFLNENSCFCLWANSRENCELNYATNWVHISLKLSGNFRYILWLYDKMNRCCPIDNCVLNFMHRFVRQSCISYFTLLYPLIPVSYFF